MEFLLGLHVHVARNIPTTMVPVAVFSICHADVGPAIQSHIWNPQCTTNILMQSNCRALSGGRCPRAHPFPPSFFSFPFPKSKIDPFFCPTITSPLSTPLHLVVSRPSISSCVSTGYKHEALRAFALSRPSASRCNRFQTAASIFCCPDILRRMLCFVGAATGGA